VHLAHYTGHMAKRAQKGSFWEGQFWTPFLTPFGGSEPGWPNGPLSLCSRWGFGPFIGHMAIMAQKGQKGGPKPVILDPFLTPFSHMAKRAKRGDYGAKYGRYWDTFWPLWPKGPKQPKGPKRGQKGVKMTQKQLFLTMFWDPFLTPFSHMAKRAKRGDYGAKYGRYWDTFWPLWPKGPKQPKGPKRGQKGSFWVVSKGLRWQTAKTGQNGHFGQKGPKWPKQPFTPYLTYRSAYNPRPL